MRLRGIDFATVENASGARGFFGEGYWYHKYWRLAGLTYAGTGFVAKTVTINSRPGNMPLKKDGITPVERFPKCIYVDLRRGITINAVGLSNIGAPALLRMGKWQQRRVPFFISFMAVSEHLGDRIDEHRAFVDEVATYASSFKGRLGVEVNISCNNVGFNSHDIVQEAGQICDRYPAWLPLRWKMDVTMPIAAAREIAQHPHCDAITTSNAIGWHKLADKIDWQEVTGKTTSPLAHIDPKGGGALSGWPLYLLVSQWMEEARESGITCPIQFCGGVTSADSVRGAKRVGASGIQTGTTGMLRPQRMRSITRQGHALWGT